jgi:hypothetical protein
MAIVRHSANIDSETRPGVMVNGKNATYTQLKVQTGIGDPMTLSISLYVGFPIGYALEITHNMWLELKQFGYDSREYS